MPPTLTIYSDRVVTGTTVGPATVSIDDGLITAVTPGRKTPVGNSDNLYVCPSKRTV